MSELRTAALTLTVVAAAFACSAASPPQTTDGPRGMTPAGWQVHTETAYRFAVSYPADLGILPETGAPANGSVKRVRFQDKQVLAGRFAELEPPRLTVEVFQGKSSSISLTDWLRSTGRLPQGAAVTRVTLAGASDGACVQLAQQLAPNTAYYFVAGDYVYAITPLGGYSAEMFASFRLL